MNEESINETITELEKKGISKTGDAVKIINGFFKENDLIKVFDGGVSLNFSIDKDGLMDLLNIIISKIDKAKNYNDFNSMINLFTDIQYEINNYFGTNKQNNRLQYYMINGKEYNADEDVKVCTMSQLKKEGIAECAEKASVANNILLVLNKLGIFPYEVNYLNAIVEIANKKDGHAFLEFSKINSKGELKHIIYDVINPEIVTYNDNEYYYPAVYLLSDQDYLEFLDGKSFDNSKFISGEYYQLKEKRTYSGFAGNTIENEIDDFTILTDSTNGIHK